MRVKSFEKIKIGRHFYFESYEYGYKVIQMEKAKKGGKKSEYKQISIPSYFPKLSQVCNHILNNSTKRAKSLEEIPEIIKKTEKRLLKAIEKIGQK